MVSTRRLKVMRKRRDRTLVNKMREYASLFDMDLAIVMQDKRTGECVLYKTSHRMDLNAVLENNVRASKNVSEKC